MKKLIKDYVFDASAKTVTMDDSIALEDLLIITNVTSGTIIYNFASVTTNGSLTNGVLTLDYDTTSMADTDKLQIFADVTSSDMDYVAKDLRIALAEIVRELHSMKKAQGVPDAWGRLRVNIDTGTLPTVSTVSTVSNIAAVGGVYTNIQTQSMSNAAWQNLRRGITVY